MHAPVGGDGGGGVLEPALHFRPVLVPKNCPLEQARVAVPFCPLTVKVIPMLHLSVVCLPLSVYCWPAVPQEPPWTVGKPVFAHAPAGIDGGGEGGEGGGGWNGLPPDETHSAAVSPVQLTVLLPNTVWHVMDAVGGLGV